MMVVPIETTPTFTSGKPRPLFSGSYSPALGGVPNFDVHPDGQRFLMIKDAQTLESSARNEINVVLNWPEELKRAEPPKK